jgi:hypothetical protein
MPQYLSYRLLQNILKQGNQIYYWSQEHEAQAQPNMKEPSPIIIPKDQSIDLFKRKKIMNTRRSGYFVRGSGEVVGLVGLGVATSGPGLLSWRCDNTGCGDMILEGNMEAET